MTDVLVGILTEQFPAVGGTERVSIYGAHERIYLNLIDRVFVGQLGPHISKNEVADIAGRIFHDVPFTLEGRGDIPLAVFFDDPVSRETYALKHRAHSIALDLASSFPCMTISTGHRGEVALDSRQRENYFQFVLAIDAAFKSNASS